MTEQPAPTQGTTSVTEPFRQRFVEEGAERDLLGVERYGTALRAHNGRDAGRDAWEEWYDLGKYLEQLRIEHADALAEIERLAWENTKLRGRLVAVELSVLRSQSSGAERPGLKTEDSELTTGGAERR